MKKLFSVFSGICLLLAGCSPNPGVTPVQPELKITATDPAVHIDENGLTAVIATDKDGVSVKLEITTNMDSWALSKDIPDWIKATRVENSLTVAIGKNEQVGGREASFKISVQNEQGSLEAAVKINQTGEAAATLELSAKDLTIPDEGGSAEITFTSNQPTVNVDKTDEWLSFSVEAGKIIFKADVNDTGSLRSAKATVTAGGGENTASETVNIEQNSIVTLTVPEKNVNIEPDGGTVEVAFTSNQKTISVKTEATWLTVVRNENTIVLTADANDTGQSRNAEVIIIAGDGDKTKSEKITVTQDILVRSLIYVIKTATDNQAVSLPTLSSADETISIKLNYGDGTPDETFDASVEGKKHTFATAGEYTVNVLTDNVIKSFSFKRNVYLYKVVNNTLNMSAVKNLDYCFSNCSILTSVAVNTFSRCTNAVNAESLFTDCKALATIPAGLLKPLTQVMSFNSIFQNCTALNAIPAGLFEGLSKIISVNNSFMNTAISEIPAKLFADCTELNKFRYTFNGCKELTTIHDDIFESCSQVTLFYAVFTNCVKLKAIPAGIFSKMTKLTDIEYTFQGCTALTKLPASLFDNNHELVNFEYAFMDCTALSGESPYTIISNTKVHLYERVNYPENFTRPSGYGGCFRNDELLDDYGTMMQAGWN